MKKQYTTKYTRGKAVSNLSMKIRLASVKPLWVQCDACGDFFPPSHMADNWMVSDLCVPCDDIIAKDLDDSPCIYDPCGV